MEEAQLNGLNEWLENKYPSQGYVVENKSNGKREYGQGGVWVKAGSCNTPFTMKVNWSMKWAENPRPLW